MKRFYCTYFDANYLVRAVALIESLQKHETADFCLYAICLDEVSRRILERLQYPNVVPVPMHALEQRDRELLAAKQNRSTVEYYWTATPTIILRILEQHPEIDVLTYLDADLFFYSSPDPIYEELGDRSVLIHEHRFPPELAHLEPTSGKYNVGLLCFRNDASGLRVLRWWRERCNEWCYAHYEDGKYGDQLYLNGWPETFDRVVVLQNVGAGLAPWNHGQYELSRDPSGRTLINETPLVFYHFHSLAFVTPELVLPIKHLTYALTMSLLEDCFLPYIEALLVGVERVHSVLPDFSFGLQTADLLSVRHTVVARTGLRGDLAKAGYPNPPFALTGELDCHYSAQLREFAGAIETTRQLAETAPEQALELLTRVDARFAASPVLKTLHAELLYGHGQVDEAIALLRAIAQEHATHMEARVDLAVILWETDQTGAALDEIVAAWEAAPNDRSVVLTAGDILTALGQPEQAQHVYRSYLRHAPQDSEVRERLSAIAPDGYLITAIVSTYNSEQFIRGCLEDLEAQTIADRLEIIVIDSGSPQNEGQIVQEFQQRYSNIKYVRTEREPLYQAWNRAIKMATGKYLTNANTDDRHRPDALERMADALENDPDVALVYSHQLINDRANVPFHESNPVGMLERPAYDRSIMLSGCHMGSHPMWRRSLHDEIGYFDERLRSAGDYEFWCRIALSHDLKLVPEVLSAYYYNTQGIELSNQGLSLKETNITQHMYRDLLTQPIEVNYYADRSRFRLAVPISHLGDLLEVEQTVSAYLQAFEAQAPVSLTLWAAPQIALDAVATAVRRALQSLGLEESDAFADIDVLQGEMEALPGLLEGSDALVALPGLSADMLELARALDLPCLRAASPESLRSVVGAWDPQAIDIVLLTHNRLEYLKRTVDALYERTQHPFRLIVVDNASDADVQAYLDAERPRFHRVIRNPENLWTHAFTQGIALTRSDPFIVSDPDILVPQREGCWLKEMLGLMEAHPELGMLALNLDASNKPARLPDVYVSDKAPHGPDITLSNVGTVMQTIRRRFFLPPYSTDWHVVEAIRARGGLVGFANHLVGYHLGWDEERDYPEHLLKKHQYFNQNYGSELYRRYTQDPALLAAMSGQPQTPVASIVVLTYNQLDVTKLCMESVLRHTDVAFEVIVVDNASTDGTPDYLQELAQKHPNVRLLLNQENRGFAGGCNQGIAQAKGEYIVLLNNDTVVSPKWLSLMIEVAQMPGVGLVGPRTNCIVGPQEHKDVPYDQATLEGFEAFAQDWKAAHHRQVWESPRVIGFCVLIRRAVIEEIGGLDTRYRTGNYEDDDFCARTKLAGFNIMVTDEVFIHHFGSVTFRKQKIDYRQLMQENWRRFKQKWLLPADQPAEDGYLFADLMVLPFDPAVHTEPIFSAEAEPIVLPDASGFDVVLVDEDAGRLARYVAAFVQAFPEGADAALHILAPGRLESAQGIILSTLDSLGMDPEHIPTLSLVDAPAARRDLPRYLQAADLVAGEPQILHGAVDMGRSIWAEPSLEALQAAVRTRQSAGLTIG